MSKETTKQRIDFHSPPKKTNPPYLTNFLPILRMYVWRRVQWVSAVLCSWNETASSRITLGFHWRTQRLVSFTPSLHSPALYYVHGSTCTGTSATAAAAALYIGQQHRALNTGSPAAVPAEAASCLHYVIPCLLDVGLSDSKSFTSVFAV